MFSSASLTILLYLLAAVFAAPSQDVGLHRPTRANITEETWDNLNLFEQYSAATHCTPNYRGHDDTKLRCFVPYDNTTGCPLVESANTTIVAKFDNTGITGMTGFIALDHTRKLIVIAFRGTESIRNYLVDFEIWLKKIHLCKGCKAHAGYWLTWKTSRHEVLSALRNATALQPDYKLIVTGHSLGGALATLCAADLRHRGHELSLYSYGSPRTCNTALANWITGQVGGNFRVTHLNDPVVQLPLPLGGYQHFAPEYYLDNPTNDTANISNIAVLQGVNNIAGSAGQAFDPSFAPHIWYFNNVTSCMGTVFQFKK